MCESQTTGLFMFVANWSDEGRNTFVMKDEMSSSQTSPEPSSGWLCKSGFCLRKTGGFWCGEPGFRVFHVLVSGRDHSMRLVRITCQWWSPVNNVVNHIRERESHLCDSLSQIQILSLSTVSPFLSIHQMLYRQEIMNEL